MHTHVHTQWKGVVCGVRVSWRNPNPGARQQGPASPTWTPALEKLRVPLGQDCLLPQSEARGKREQGPFGAHRLRGSLTALVDLWITATQHTHRDMLPQRKPRAGIADMGPARLAER